MDEGFMVLRDKTPVARTRVHFLHSKEFCAILLVMPCKILSSSTRIFSLPMGVFSVLFDIYLSKLKVQAPLPVCISASLISHP
ncbi:hypothetical protein [Helicobacter acinonychis]|uniref:hypothetical protein n=1 Tax=Helicobacter acinonychis TaxID=212 RepID=UPI0003253F7D|nr:hypothetical protein [Helicobacter acinonychis]